MLIFDCTQATCDFFSAKVRGKVVCHVKQAPADEPEAVDSANPAVMDRWQLHCIKMGRYHLMIAAHVKTRYAMLFVGLKKNDLQGFLTQFRERYVNEMWMLARAIPLSLPSEPEVLARCAQWMATMHEYVFYKRGDRSVQTHINQVFDHAYYCAYEGEGLPVETMDLVDFDATTNRLLRRIGSKGDYFLPDERQLQMCYPLLGGSLSPDAVAEGYKAYRSKKWAITEE